jgi:aminoglycoside 3-N-acetyltransferase
MSPGKLLLKFVSPDTFRRLRRVYLKIKRKVYRPFTEEQFRQILTEKLGIKKGSVVFVHSAADNLNLAFPFYKILPMLLDIVGEEGTVLFPCWHFDYRAEEYLEKDGVFDVKKSPAVLGILAEFARHYKNACRSYHPTASVVAIGKHAQELTKDHVLSEYPCDENSPFYKIIQYNGIIVGLGVSTYNLSFVHCVEDVMKKDFPLKTRTDKVYDAKVRKPDGEMIVVKTRAAHWQIRYREVEAYVHQYIPVSICNDFKFKATKFFTANAAELFTKMKSLATDGITIYKSEAEIKN